jgi:general nucleoside transport system permease protein
MTNQPHSSMTKADLVFLAERRRYRTIGSVMILLAILSVVFFAIGMDPQLVSTFALKSPGLVEAEIADLILPSHLSIIVLSSVNTLLGIYQLVKSFGKRSNMVLGLSILIWVFSFMIWATAGKSTNLTGMLRLSVVQAIPLIFGALSGIISERAGVVNIAIEGLMLVAAMVGVIVSSATGNIHLGLLAALVASGLTALLHAILSIHYKVDQIISGMVINIFATGITSYIGIKFLVDFPNLNLSGLYPNFAIPGLSQISILGPIFFNQNIFFYLAFFMLVLMQFVLFHTPWGLRTRMVGEHPRAADTLGINVHRKRYVAVILSGILAGFGGAYLTLGAVGRFNRLMTAGRGYIGLAAMIFGNWNPFGALGASLIFGFSSSLESKISILQAPIPSQILGMAPYLATIIILVGVVGKVTAPAADGQPYDNEG